MILQSSKVGLPTFNVVLAYLLFCLCLFYKHVHREVMNRSQIKILERKKNKTLGATTKQYVKIKKHKHEILLNYKRKVNHCVKKHQYKRTYNY